MGADRKRTRRPAGGRTTLGPDAGDRPAAAATAQERKGRASGAGARSRSGGEPGRPKAGPRDSSASAPSSAFAAGNRAIGSADVENGARGKRPGGHGACRDDRPVQSSHSS